MTSDPESVNADPADPDDQVVVPADLDDEATPDPEDLPWEADEADVAEQRTAVPDEDDDTRGDG